MSSNTEYEEKPKIGRPKGATDVVPRKQRSDRELMANPQEISEITAFNYELMKLPPVDNGNRQQVEDRIYWYFEQCINKGIRPGVAGLCLSLGICRATWGFWGNGRERDYKDLVEKSRAVLEAITEQYMLQGKINPVTGIFLLKNNFGYTDKSEVVLTPNNNPLGEPTDIEALKQKYLDNTYGLTSESDDFIDFNGVNE